MRDIIGDTLPQLARRGRQVRKLLTTEGIGGVGTRTRRVLADWIRPTDRTLAVRPQDLLAADLTKPRNWSFTKVGPGERIAINWVTTPPGEGSGGHTTLFRIINHLSAKGYDNRVYFYDVYGADQKFYEGITRRAFGFQGPIGSVADGMADAQAVVASSWPTAYPVYASPCAGARFYFVQDFEPYFHPTSTESILADNTYRMGFHAITAGRWLARKLAAEYAMKADHFDFGCDTSRYRRSGGSRRRGVAFYARPSATRRGFEIGVLALEFLARRRPELELHLYGEKLGALPFAHIGHGSVSPDRLNQIYNQCFAGLSLSLTNVSLVPHEMLASGCVPVVNDAEHNRLVLDNPFVRYAAPTPHALASEIEALADLPDFDALSAAAADSVKSTRWEDAGDAVDAVFRRELTA